MQRVDAGETITDTIDFSQTYESDDDESEVEKVEALTEIICRAGDEATAALFVLMGTLQNSPQPEVLVHAAKPYAFTRCGELNVFGMVDAQMQPSRVNYWPSCPDYSQTLVRFSPTTAYKSFVPNSSRKSAVSILETAIAIDRFLNGGQKILSSPR
ncbi:MAG TPA: hypothetical protein VHQ94_13315 [Pyrinomonadaceae bacterium]|nr:hypothetical protein [Pyrinomonadaceae bacterium]